MDIGHSCPKQTHVDVIHQHKEDRQTTKEIDSIYPHPAAVWACGFSQGEVLSRKGSSLDDVA
jgi:hypothetical protein